jgi:hypothetical protein
MTVRMLRQKLVDHLGRMRAGITGFAGTRAGRRVRRLVHGLFLVAILGWLFVQMSGIGWERIWQALPRTPWFYVIFAAAYLILPLTEALIYRVSWGFRYIEGIPAFFKKRVYNNDVLGYAGEIYLFTWARRKMNLTDGQVLRTIRDNNIVSSFASTSVAIALLAAFVFTGQIQINNWLIDYNRLHVAMAGIVIVVVVLLAARFRRYLYSLSLKLTVALFAIYVTRLLIANVLQVTQWAVVEPQVPMQTWFTFLAMMIIMDRIPLLPNRDLIFMGIGLQLAAVTAVAPAAMAGMLLVNSVMAKALNLSFMLVSAIVRRRGHPDFPLHVGDGASEPEAPAEKVAVSIAEQE